MRKGLQIQSGPAQSLLGKKRRGRRWFSKSWEKRGRCTLQVCNTITTQGAVVSQTSQKSQFPEYIMLRGEATDHISDNSKYETETKMQY